MKALNWEQIQKEQAKLKEAEHALAEEGRKCAPVPQYRYKVVVLGKGGSWEPLRDCTECIQIVGTLLNAEEKNAHMAKYGSIKEELQHRFLLADSGAQLCIDKCVFSGVGEH